MPRSNIRRHVDRQVWGRLDIHLIKYYIGAAGEAMAPNPTAEETALKILYIFVHHFKYRPGDVLQRLNFFSRIEAKDFAPGMKFAAQQGWVEVIRGGASFMLTAAGFAKA